MSSPSDLVMICRLLCDLISWQTIELKLSPFSTCPCPCGKNGRPSAALTLDPGMTVALKISTTSSNQCSLNWNHLCCGLKLSKVRVPWTCLILSDCCRLVGFDVVRFWMLNQLGTEDALRLFGSQTDIEATSRQWPATFYCWFIKSLASISQKIEWRLNNLTIIFLSENSCLIIPSRYLF